MSRRLTITFICDECGRKSDHEQFCSGFSEQIYTMKPIPKDWTMVKQIGGSAPIDYCPACTAGGK